SPAQLAALSPRLQTATSVPMRAVRKLLTQYTHPVLRSVAMFSAFWNDEARRALLPALATSPLAMWRRDWLHAAFAHADEAIDRMLWLDTHTSLAGDLLVKMDIASMHCGLETRSPLLDHEVIELCARLPVHLKVKGGVGKYLLKRLAERYYPRDFVHRPKMGFGIPLVTWLRGPLREVLDRTLGNDQLMAPLSPAVIAHTLREFEHGRDDHGSRLWALLM